MYKQIATFAIAATLALLLYPLSLASQNTFSLSLDADSAAGDQAVTSVNTSADQEVSIQVFGSTVQNATAFGLRFEYDDAQVTYQGFDAGSVLPGTPVLLPPEHGANPTSVKIGFASLGSQATVNSGLVCTIRFRTTATFSGTSISLVQGDLSRGGATESVTLTARVDLSSGPSADFDGDGSVGISDFLQFVNHFGTSRGGAGYDAKYDLDSDGTIGISDFLVFVNNFGSQAPTNTTRATGDEEVFTLPGSASVEMVWIEPGTFQYAPWGNAQEVRISQGFYLGKYEVTQGQWEAVMGTTPWQGKRYVLSNPNHPVQYISGQDAQAFVDRLNAAEGANVYRVPTDKEWEYACRAGTTTLWSFGDDESQATHYVWYFGNSWAQGQAYGHPVGQKRPNPWGLYDMHGNVWELIQIGSNYYARGGHFGVHAETTQSHIRYEEMHHQGQSIENYGNGFRLLRQAD